MMRKKWQRNTSADLLRMRQRLGWTQMEMAIELGVSLPTINRWENARSSPSHLAAEKIESLRKRNGMGGSYGG